MNRCGYEQRAKITIAAPIERVYAIASDPLVVPCYADEIRRIEILSDDGRGGREVRSHIRVLGLTIPFRYRYWYRPPLHYGGVQARGSLVQGYFTLRFRALNENTTEVEHVEGIVSRIPLLETIVGWAWFALLSRDGVAAELAKLKQLVEGLPTSASPSA
jgi:hypothetical protein